MKEKAYVELSYDKERGEVLGIAYHFNLFSTSTKPYVYRKGKLKDILLNEEYKDGVSYFKVYISRYDYPLQVSFMKELHCILYNAVGKYVDFNNPFNLPEDEYIGHTLEGRERVLRERNVIEEAYEKNVFGKWYTKSYDDGEIIEIKMDKNNTFIPYGGDAYIDIIARYEDDDNYYQYKGKLEKPFDVSKLERH